MSKNELTIMKFGGAALALPDGINSLAQILNENNSKKILVIVSAIGKTSRNLEKAADLALNGSFENAYRYIYEYLYFTVSDINQNNNFTNKIFNLFESKNVFETLKKLLKGIELTKEITPKTYDKLLSLGEELTLIVLSEIFSNASINFTIINSKDYMFTNNEHTKAKPLINETSVAAKKLIGTSFDKYDIVLTQGFVGKSIEGNITTMGFESSNLTALVLAEIFQTKSLTVWTDVEGIFTADPKIFKSAEFISEIDYEFAKKAALNGLKLFYPTMLDYAKRNNVIIEFRKLTNGNENKTTINSSAEYSKPMFILLNAELYEEEINNDNILNKYNTEQNTQTIIFKTLEKIYIINETQKKTGKGQEVQTLKVLNINIFQFQQIFETLSKHIICSHYLQTDKTGIFILEKETDLSFELTAFS